MSECSADFIEFDGHRALRLRYRHIPRDPRQVDLLLVHEADTGAAEHFPAAYQFIPPTAARPYPMLRIVAAPGISVRHSFPTEYSPLIDHLPLLFIYRVQDPSAVWPMGVDIVERQLLAPYAVNAPSDERSDDPLPVGYFQIVPRPNGVVIRHPLSAVEMRVTVPLDAQAAEKTSDAQARFSFEIIMPASPTGDEPAYAQLLTTPGVSTAFATIPRDTGPTPRRLSPWALVDAFRVYQLPGFADVPPQGTGLTPDERYRVTRFARVDTLEETLAMAFFDISLGFVPVVGDLVDVAELVYGLVTGEDRWGRPLSTNDLVLMGIGALLPIVAAPVLRRGRQLAQTFGRHVDVADEALEVFKAARFDGHDAEVAARQTALVQRGLNIDARASRGLLEKLTAVSPKPLGLDDLVNASGGGFTQPELQALYAAYARGRTVPSLPRLWALNVSTGRPRQLLEALLGKDYVTLAGGRGSVRPKNLIDVPRPDGFTDAQVATQLQRLSDPSKLFERLGNLLDQLNAGDDAARAVARTRINAGHFRILKGNIAEILAREKQLAALHKVTQDSRFADAVLVSGVRMRLPVKPGSDRKTAALLFSDNIIAVIKGDKLQVLTVFEVKSGYLGGAEATEQVFKWIERNVEDGAELVLEDGAQLVRADGSALTLSRALSFTYNPSKPGVPQVVGLQNAQRTLITADGVSHLGVESSQQISKEVQREVLDDLSSAHLDYLAAQVVQRHL